MWLEANLPFIGYWWREAITNFPSALSIVGSQTNEHLE